MADDLNTADVNTEILEETQSNAATATAEEQPLWFGLTGSMWFLISSVVVLLLALLLKVLG